MPVDVKALFDQKTEIRTTFRDRVLIHTFKFPDRREWLEYQRRASNYRVRKGKVTASDDAAGVRLWVYDEWCEKVEVEDGAERVAVENFKDLVPAMVKDYAAIAFLGQIQPDEEDEKNS
jgi:hypothetical protein